MIEPRSFLGGKVTLYHADCRDVLKQLPDNSIDSICTDPPYALVSIQKRFGKPGSKPAKDVYGRGAAGFMGKQWDTGEVAFSEVFWAEVLRVLKPGGHVVAFSGTRTYHRMAVAIEDAGLEIRDQLGWLYGSGFPKSHDVSKGIDKRGPEGQAPFAEFAAHYEERRKALGMTHAAICAAGGWFGKVNHGGSSVNWANGYGMPTTEQWAILQPLLVLDEKWSERVARVQYEREVLGIKHGTKLAVAPGQENDRGAAELEVTAPGSDAAREWQGWGTALKPAWEPICLARKPLIGTVAENVLAYGTGALNIDGCRIEGEDVPEGRSRHGGGLMQGSSFQMPDSRSSMPAGRWPANIVHDGSDEVLAAFPEAGGGYGKRGAGGQNGVYSPIGGTMQTVGYGDSGSAARFFYCAKASRKDRDEGLEGFERKVDETHQHGMKMERWPDGTLRERVTPPAMRANTHPTVKPTDLMRWLCRLVTPPGGVILDPFMGSGSTGKAALLEGFKFIGCEREDEYMPIAEARIAAALLRTANDNKPVAAPAAVAANSNQPDLFGRAA